MTGRERVLRAVEFRSPDRAPRDVWALPAVQVSEKAALARLHADFPMDIRQMAASPGQRAGELKVQQIGRYRDDWGSVWAVAEIGVIGEVVEPVLADTADIAGYQPPWHLLENRDRDGVNRFCAESDQFVLSECTARPFERLQFLRGTANLFMDIAYGSEEFLTLRDRVHEFYLKDVAWWCETDVDGIMFMDDWGTQQALLIAPKQWRELFKPLYREVVALMKAAGKKAFFHSDGHIMAIYPDLIEIGVDAVNSQLFCMDIEEIGRLYKGRISFWGELDRQRILPFGTPDEVRAGVARVRRALDDGTGGVFAQCEWGKNNPEANIRAMYEAWA